MDNVVRTMNPLKAWILESREEQRRAPKRYLANYPEIGFVGDKVMMTKETLATIELHCGRYETSFPTGQYCGKMFLRGKYLCWYGISKQNPMKLVQMNYREIIILDELEL
jgi:hypothetical protein